MEEKGERSDAREFLKYWLATSQSKMGSINIFKPLSTTFLKPAPLINLNNIDNFPSWECWETNLGLLGEKQVCYAFRVKTFESKINTTSGFSVKPMCYFVSTKPMTITWCDKHS